MASPRETGGTPDPDHAGAPRRIGRLDALRRAGSRRACSPGGTAPKERRPARRSRVLRERSGSKGATLRRRDGRWRHHCGGGADPPPSVRTTMRHRSASAGCCGGGCGGRPSGRTNRRCSGTARLAGSGGRRGGGCTAEAAGACRLRPEGERCRPTRTPDTRRHLVESLDKTSVAAPGTSVREPKRGIGVTNHANGALRCGRERRGRQRQEGNGRSDAVRLSARGMLRRV